MLPIILMEIDTDGREKHPSRKKSFLDSHPELCFYLIGVLLPAAIVAIAYFIAEHLLGSCGNIAITIFGPIGTTWLVLCLAALRQQSWELEIQQRCAQRMTRRSY